MTIVQVIRTLAIPVCIKIILIFDYIIQFLFFLLLYLNFFSVVTESPSGPYTGPLNTTPHVGCPAALKCVDESYCTWDGIMSDTPVTLTKEQLENKVPLSVSVIFDLHPKQFFKIFYIMFLLFSPFQECQNIETGIIGKCCRDPNYKDPWPDHLPHEGHDGHGHDGHDGHDHHHPPGTNFVSCGSTATCTSQSKCTGDSIAQFGKVS